MIQRLKNAWGWILSILGIVFAVLLGARRIENGRIKKRVDNIQKEAAKTHEAVGEAKAVLEASEKVAKDEEAKIADRKERAKKLADRLKKLNNGTFILMLVVGIILVGTIVVSAEAPAVPKDYDTLLKYYLEAVDVAAEYKQLYEEAEASNKTLLNQVKLLQEQVAKLTETIDKLQKWLDEMQATVMKLLARKPLGFIGGLTVTGFNPPQPGAFVGVNIGF